MLHENLTENAVKTILYEVTHYLQAFYERKDTNYTIVNLKVPFALTKVGKTVINIF